MKTYKLEDLSEDDKKTANELISERISAAYSLISECEAIADKTDTRFTFELTYGAGASYRRPKEDEKTEWGDPFDGWVASSTTC